MHITMLALVGSKVEAADEALVGELTVSAVEPDGRRGLLATVVSSEDARYQLAYAALICHALRLGPDGRPEAVDLLRPLEVLRPDEQEALRGALVASSWPAWARAPHHLRRLLGEDEPPLLLADVARDLMLPLPTLANAASRERLPTIRAGDRHLVYRATIQEAEARGLLHHQRGRPRRG